jgi:hypothetical protein
MTGMTYPVDDDPVDNPDTSLFDWNQRAKNRRMVWMKAKDGAELKEQGIGFEKVGFSLSCNSGLD